MKIKLGAKNYVYPLPIVLTGANVNGKPNYITIALGIADPGSVSLGMNKAHYPNIGIKENGTFSIKIPSVDLVKETGYCGLVSGRNVDKPQIFNCFYRELETASKIKERTVNMECKVIKTVDLPDQDGMPMSVQL